MKNFRFNYIITIHNKEHLIRQILEALLSCVRENSFIYPVLDGCTDNTEKIIDKVIKENPQVSITKVYAPDVHELKSINIGLRAADQTQKGCNIILQDDVIIDEPNLEQIVYRIYDYFGYENVGYLSFRHGVNIYLKDEGEVIESFKRKSQKIEERDLIESAYGTGMSPIPLSPHYLIERMATVGSPQCLSCEVVNTIGVMDENLAPVTYSCHDISLRCLEAGKRNFVFGLKFRSDIAWGGTHTAANPNNPHAQAVLRNPFYLYSKHKKFIQAFHKTNRYRELKVAKPLSIIGITTSEQEDRQAIREYYIRRNRAIGRQTHLISKYIKLPLKWALIRLGLY